METTEARRQHVMDITMYKTCMDSITRGENVDLHRDILNRRAEDIKEKVQNAIADVFQMPDFFLPKCHDEIEEIIHYGFGLLTSIEMNILNCCNDLHNTSNDMPWYEYEVLNYLYHIVIPPIYEKKKQNEVTICLDQGDIKFMVTIPKIVAKKMGEITTRDKDIDYRLCQLDLVVKAMKELEKEGWINESKNTKDYAICNLTNLLT